MVFGRPVLVEECRVTLLQVRTVPQDDLRDGGSRRAGVDPAGESFAHQPGQITGVVKVGVRDHDGVDARRIDRQWLPVEFPKVLHPLEQAAIQQDSLLAALQQVLGTRDRAGRAQAAESKQARIR